MGKNLRKAKSFFNSVGDISDPVVLLHGEETYLVDEALDRLLDALAPEGGFNDFNLDVFYGKEIDADTIRKSAETLPVMGDIKVVVVKEAQQLSAAAFDALIDYFESPSEHTCLIFHAIETDGDSLDGNRKGIRSLKKHARCQEFSNLYENEVEQILPKHASRYDLKLSNRALAYLIQAVGTDLKKLHRALEKIDLYVGETDEATRSVSADTIREIVAETKIGTVFDLTDALGARNLGAAIKQLHKMMDVGEPALRILTMIARHFRILAKLKDPEIRKKSSKQQANAVGVVPFFLDDYRKDARRFSLAEIIQLHERLLEADRSLKSSHISPEAVMEKLIFDICRESDSEEASAPS
jgi:DNA polymerase-3 subunit delta